jgi:quercetin dioxygenase-like cupin family protein
MNRKLKFGASLFVGALLTTLDFSVAADDSATKPAAVPALAYLHLYVDAQGVSHFRKEELVSRTLSVEGVAEPLSTYQFAGAKSATLVWLKRGAVEDWHKAPRRQFLLGVQGGAEVTAGDGVVKRVMPGTIMLMDDTSGKGHITKTLGNADHIALVIPVPAD